MLEDLPDLGQLSEENHASGPDTPQRSGKHAGRQHGDPITAGGIHSLCSRITR